MNRMQGAILFFIFPLVLISQVKTPFVTYDYQSDSRYKKELEFLKKKENMRRIEQMAAQRFSVNELVLL